MRLSTLALTLGAAASATARTFEHRSNVAKPLPKRHVPRGDDFWDYVTKGADLAEGKVSAAEADGFDISNFNLRAHTVDPGSLGIDDVKQYSGYLDNDEDDKHLFYCELPRSLQLGIEC